MTNGCLRDYRRYWNRGHVPNPAFRRPEDTLVLDLKEGSANGIWFAREQFLHRLEACVRRGAL